MTYRALWLALAACSSTAPRTDTELSQAAKQGIAVPNMGWPNGCLANPITPTPYTGCSRPPSSLALCADKKIRASAAWQVGDWYQAGLGEPKNPTLATLWWQRSARLSNT